MTKDDGYMFISEVTQVDILEKEWDKMAVDKEAGGIPLEFITLKQMNTFCSDIMLREMKEKARKEYDQKYDEWLKNKKLAEQMEEE
jgi:hypothetical protein